MPQAVNDDPDQDKDDNEGMPLYKDKREVKVMLEDEDVIGEHLLGYSGMRKDVGAHLQSHWHCVETDVEWCFG